VSLCENHAPRNRLQPNSEPRPEHLYRWRRQQRGQDRPRFLMQWQVNCNAQSRFCYLELSTSSCCRSKFFTSNVFPLLLPLGEVYSSVRNQSFSSFSLPSFLHIALPMFSILLHKSLSDRKAVGPGGWLVFEICRET
jgi:hypothetical protein